MTEVQTTERSPPVAQYMAINTVNMSIPILKGISVKDSSNMAAPLN